ncbi:SH3 domain-containing protein [Aquimarina sp. M1]
MKKLLIIFLLISKTGFGQDTKYISENYEFTTGEIAYMFGNDVKLRDQPNTESRVLSLLKIGEQIEIIEKSDSKMKFDGIESPWYKVKTKGNIGFVLGSLISLDKSTNGAFTYLISLKKDGLRLFLKTRVLENGSSFKENVSQLLTGEFSIKTTGNKGLEKIKSIFEIDYLAESCGVNGGGMYLFYDGNDLLKVIDYTSVADGDLYWFKEEYIFPDEKDGIKGKIVYKSEIGETKDYETEWTENKTIRRILGWNGKEIIPKIKNEKEE